MAREKALANARAIAEGRDPRRRIQQVPTFEKANETVLAIHARHWKSTRTESQWRASMRDYVLPRLARKRVDAVTTADVMAVLLPIWSTKRVTAGRVRQRISAVMKWAVAQGYRDDNPAGDVLSAALPKTAVRKQHMRALPHAEVSMPKSVHAVQARLPRLALVDLELLPVVAPRRDQGAATHLAPRLVEQLPLPGVAHRHLPRTATLGDRALEPDTPAPGRRARA